jgi:hypothetical protein
MGKKGGDKSISLLQNAGEDFPDSGSTIRADSAANVAQAEATGEVCTDAAEVFAVLGMTWWQILLYVSASFAQIPSAIGNLGASFMCDLPEWCVLSVSVSVSL